MRYCNTHVTKLVGSARFYVKVLTGIDGGYTLEKQSDDHIVLTNETELSYTTISFSKIDKVWYCTQVNYSKD